MSFVTVANDTSDHHYAGARLKSGTATTFVGCQFLQGLFSMLIDVEDGDSVLNTTITAKCYLDSASQAALWCTATGSGNIARIMASSSWFSTAGQGEGIVLASMGTGASDGVEIDGCELVLNSGSGLKLTDAKWKNTRVNGGVAAGNNIGVELAAGVSDVSVRNMTIGASDGFAGNSNGMFIAAGAGDRIEIQNNTMRGNTSTTINSATGLNNRIEGNAGYNDTPVGSSIAVGASPFTHRAGPSPETIYISGGTVSAIVVAGVTAFTNTGHTVELAPNETVQVTYSSAPFMNRVRH
ncbi:hypothetical protein [Chelativorans sp. M5D2P16]|uniref:hypothetical protein n=1 Tax=Chelativorans sp. M5D2P16 TaxID=3095678 RepID=UPI002ACA1FDD|nr:hypothetical protein [Chelativorans sp. M5D2P16]MDZ5697634.1 hypothetical protein [Chelativorans sp. M5D2P16]